MSYVLFLDDERLPEQVTWVDFPRYEVIHIVRSYNGFVKQLEIYGVPMFVCFDHDLTDDHYVAMLQENDPNYAGVKNVDYGPEKTGYDCAKYLVEFCKKKNVKLPGYVVHSMNPAGKVRIESYLENAKKHLGL
jgi:hypothetical protein